MAIHTHTYKALSLWQPWASLCCISHPANKNNSVKGYETRSWATKHRGMLLIHAAKNKSEISECSDDENFVKQIGRYYESFNDLPLGAIIGYVNLLDCLRTEDVRKYIDDYAWEFGNYGDGRFAWNLTKPFLFEKPIPMRGYQGLFDVRIDLSKHLLPMKSIREKMTEKQQLNLF